MRCLKSHKNPNLKTWTRTLLEPLQSYTTLSSLSHSILRKRQPTCVCLELLLLSIADPTQWVISIENGSYLKNIIASTAKAHYVHINLSFLKLKIRPGPTFALLNQPYPSFLAFLCQNLPTYTYLPFRHFEYLFYRKTSKIIIF